jgi:hypothetical protein
MADDREQIASDIAEPPHVFTFDEAVSVLHQRIASIAYSDKTVVTLGRPVAEALLAGLRDRGLSPNA